MNSRSTRLALSAVAFLLSGSLAKADYIDQSTNCTVATTAFYSGDKETILTVSQFVQNTYEQLDAIHTGNGEPGIMAQFTDQAVNGLIAQAIESCREHPDATIYDAAAEVYRGTRDLELPAR